VINAHEGCIDNWREAFAAVIAFILFKKISLAHALFMKISMLSNTNPMTSLERNHGVEGGKYLHSKAGSTSRRP
jgi:hypothetical protein